MPVKQLDVPNIGLVKFYKRRNARSIKISLGRGDEVRVSLPMWVPYRAGLEFLKSHASWIEEHRQPKTALIEGARIGKYHQLTFISIDGKTNISTRVTGSRIVVRHPSSISSRQLSVQTAAHKASLTALRLEADNLLPQRLDQLASRYSFKYRSVKVRNLRSRWGSCSQQKNIGLNIYLMLLPWPLIDYVLLHELTHTKFLSHSQEFWDHLQSCLPNAKQLRKELRAFHPVI